MVQRRKIVGSSAPPTSFGLRCSNSFTNYFLKSPISPVPTTNPTLVTIACESADYRSDEDLCDLIWCAVVCLFRSRVALQAEILVLRQQLNVLRCKSPRRVRWAFEGPNRPDVFGGYREREAQKVTCPFRKFDPSGFAV